MFIVQSKDMILIKSKISAHLGRHPRELSNTSYCFDNLF